MAGKGIGMAIYPFTIFEKASVSPTPGAVVYGIDHQLLPTAAVNEFEEWQVLHGDSNGITELLIFDGNSTEAVKALERAGYHDSGKGMRELRYAVLASLDSTGQELLDKIESVYSDFDYPRDMEPFIYYMPNDNDDPTDGPEQRFREFLHSEKAKLNL